MTSVKIPSRKDIFPEKKKEKRRAALINPGGAPYVVCYRSRSKPRYRVPCYPFPAFYRSVPRKNRATVPGPEWVPITGPME